MHSRGIIYSLFDLGHEEDSSIFSILFIQLSMKADDYKVRLLFIKRTCEVVDGARGLSSEISKCFYCVYVFLVLFLMTKVRLVIN